MKKEELLILLEEARISFDLIDKETEKIFQKTKSYLYINFFYLTSLITLFNIIRPQIDSFVGLIFVSCFTTIFIIFILLILSLAPKEYRINPDSQYYDFEKEYENNEVLENLIQDYEEATDENSNINLKVSSNFDLIFYSMFIPLVLLIIILIVYILQNG